jgi:hypothetical protein
MVRFAPTDAFNDESPTADPRGEAPVALPPRRSRRLAAPSFEPTNPLLEQAFPSWARPPKEPAVGADAGADAAFRAGASLALLDQILRLDPPFAGVLRQRPALRAATACAKTPRTCATPNISRRSRPKPVPPGAFTGSGACSRPAQCGSTPRPCESRRILLD